ncbi:Histone-lysine N-methyltransferase SUVR4 [Morella rubra]|uniref:Histone-lysine N-methyltransferase SUVR4 n=1 Tax=Morella rubra TaxID=262757 RepID=A0A6A1UUZ9_9ROSI|nr:Histone-lysine N-methyltransferase SUVR4 [Morella rubra]
MAPHPRVLKAYRATRALGIPDEEVKPVLKRLLKVYDEKWELIEEDNYRTLLDAYFELKENRKDAMQPNEGLERSTKRRHLEEQKDWVSSMTDNSSHMLAVEKNALKTSGQGIMELSQPCSVGDPQLRRTHFMGKGKDPISYQVVAGDKNSTSEKALSGMVTKSPMHRTSSALVRRGNMQTNHQDKILIPETDQFCDYSLPEPSTILPPELPRLSNNPPGNHSVKGLASRGLHLCNKDGSSASQDNTSLVTYFNIASSPLGEVTISLNCDSALRQLNFHIPKLDDVLRYMEKKYLRSYKIVGPQFSMRKLLKDLCESYLKLGTDAPDRSVVVNSSSKFGVDVGDALHVVRRKKRAFEIHNFAVDSIQKGADCSGHTNSSDFVHGEKRPFREILDISKGSEKVRIPLVYEIGKERLPEFNYIPHNIIYQSGNVNISLARIVDEDCCSGCSGDCLSSSIPCACARETGGEFAYTPHGPLKEEFLSSCMSMRQEPQEHNLVFCQDCPQERTKNKYMPEQCKGHLVRKFIKECWRKCGCDMQCGNRTVQRGITCKLQVFLTPEGKGWGVRTLEDLPKGAFVCEYVGEVLTNMELYERNLQGSGNERHTYPVLLDADWGSEGFLRDEEALCLDATCHGNVARFINHSGGFTERVVTLLQTAKKLARLPCVQLAFFTTTKVGAFEELTWVSRLL